MLSAFVVGCASRRPNLIAHTGGIPVRFDFRKVSLMPKPSLTPQERALNHDLAAELQRRGIVIVPRTESDLTIAIGIETHSELDIQTTPASVAQAPPPFISGMVYQGGAWVQTTTTEREIRTEGIRLRLYPTRELAQGRFQTAWEGYLEAGFRMRPEHQAELLRTLLDHVGQNFVGRVKTP